MSVLGRMFVDLLVLLRHHDPPWKASVSRRPPICQLFGPLAPPRPHHRPVDSRYGGLEDSGRRSRAWPSPAASGLLGVGASQIGSG